MLYTCTATCLFGLEKIVKNEILNLGFSIKNVTDGHVEFLCDDDGIFKANYFLRTAERVQINLLEFKAESFEELYDNINEINWYEYMPENADFKINGRSYNSKLFSISDCQRITEKAIIDSMNRKYKKNFYEKNGDRYVFEISLINDIATLYLNSSGAGLHMRGYRLQQGSAPIKETLASGLIQLSVWNKDRILLDPFTGSGTIPIEAMMIGRNIPAGIFRKFDCEKFMFLNKDNFQNIRKQGVRNVDKTTKLKIYASDYDRNMIQKARENISKFPFPDDVFFFTKEVRKLELENDYGVIITNPPYGKRLDDQLLNRTYENFKTLIDKLTNYSIYVITDYNKLEEVFKRKATKKRKLYNGNLRTDYYQFLGPKPIRGENVQI